MKRLFVLLLIAWASASGQITINYNNVGSVSSGVLMGRSSAGVGYMQPITIGSGLTMSSGVLSATGSGLGTVTSVGVVGSSSINVAGTSPITSAGTLTLSVNIVPASSVSGLATVATTGSYSSLSGKPTLLSQFTNDPGFITAPVSATTSISGLSTVATTAPYVVLWPANTNAATLGFNPYVTSTTNSFTVNSGITALTAATAYIYNFHVIQ